MVEPKLRELIKAVTDSADIDGCPPSTVNTNKSAVDALRDYIGPCSQEDFVANTGERCPFCDNTGIEFDDRWCLHGSMVSQECTCPECKATWDEEYTLSGYTA
jgi:hypothetical protein